MKFMKRNVCLMLVVLFLMQMFAFVNVKAEVTMSPLQRVVVEGLSLPDGTGDGTRIGLYQTIYNFIEDKLSQEDVVKIIKSKYITSMNEEDINNVLNIIKGLNNDTKTLLLAIIKSPNKIASSNEFPNIKAKINRDLTTNAANDSGLLLFYNILYKSYYALYVKGIYNSTLVTDDSNDKSKIYFDRLEELKGSIESLNNMLYTIESLPFEPKTFDGFVNNYETFINRQSESEIKAFKKFLNGPNGDAGIYVPNQTVPITPTNAAEVTPTVKVSPTMGAIIPTNTVSVTPTSAIAVSPTKTASESTPTSTTKKHRGGKGGSYISVPDDKTVLGSTKDLKVKITAMDSSKLNDAQKSQIGVNEKVYEVSMEDGSKITGLGRFGIPYELKPGEDPRKVTVFLITDDGKLKNKIGEYDETTKTVKVITKELGLFVAKYNNITYNDLGNYGWAKDFIEVLSAKGIIYGIGDNFYAPDKMLTRSEFAALIVRAFNLNDESASSSFVDVNVNEWYYKEVSSAVKAGLIVGRPDNTFAPNDILSRQDMCVIMSKVLTAYLGESLVNTEDEINKFTDKADIADYSKPYVATIVKFGIMIGEPSGKFNPQSSTNRAQAAVATYKLFMED